MPNQIDVVGAVIIRDGLVYCTQRGGAGALAGKWEFPGGKIEPDESSDAALKREIAEELACVVEVGDQVETTHYAYEFGVVALTTYYCRLVEGEPVLSEHQAAQWVDPGNLHTLDWAPADVPAVVKVQNDLVAQR